MNLKGILIIFSCLLFLHSAHCQPKSDLMGNEECFCPYSAKSYSSGIEVYGTADNSKNAKLISRIDLSAQKFKVNSQVSVAMNKDSGEFRNRIFLCWSDIRNGGIKNEDIYLMYSDDLGKNWSDPILVSYRPNHKRQFLPAIRINHRGQVMIAYYDQQNYLNEDQADLSLAVSDNGGLKFDIIKISHASFKAKPGSIRFSDCIPGHSFWLEFQKSPGKLSVLPLNDSILQLKRSEGEVGEISMEKTFFYADEIKINFRNDFRLKMSAAITRPLEPGFERIVLKNKTFEAGDNGIVVKTKELGLKKGSYVLTLYFNGKNIYCWIIAED